MFATTTTTSTTTDNNNTNTTNNINSGKNSNTHVYLGFIIFVTVCILLFSANEPVSLSHKQGPSAPAPYF